MFVNIKWSRSNAILRTCRSFIRTTNGIELDSVIFAADSKCNERARFIFTNNDIGIVEDMIGWMTKFLN